MSKPLESFLHGEALPRDVADLQDAIDRLPVEYNQPLAGIMQRVVDSTLRRRQILNLVQESISQLRLDMKYMMFDLEATRRERDDYRDRCAEGDGDEC